MLLLNWLELFKPFYLPERYTMKATYAERQANGKWTVRKEVKTVLDVSGDMAKADSEGRPWRFRTEDGVVFDNRHLLEVTKQYAYSRMGK